MEARIKSIFEQFSNPEKDICVPQYQRPYSWTVEEVDRLLEDIEAIADDSDAAHFCGSMILTGESDKYILVDGQQRFVTIFLILLAGYKLDSMQSMVWSSDDQRNSAKHAIEILLFSAIKRNRPRLRLTDKDQNSFRLLIESMTNNRCVDSSLLESNFVRIEKWLRGTDIPFDRILSALRRLNFLMIELGHGDDPQEIFDSVNSAGAPLSETDKIRNLVLMVKDVELQTILFEEFWRKVEINCGDGLHDFLFYYSLLQGMSAKKSSLYKSFRLWYLNGNLDARELLEDLLEYSECYKLLTKSGSFDDRLLDAVVRRTRAYSSKGMPLAVAQMTLVKLLRSSKLTRDEFKRAFTILEGLLVRSFVTEAKMSIRSNDQLTLLRDVQDLCQGSTLSFSDCLLREVIRRFSKLVLDENCLVNSIVSVPVSLSSTKLAYVFDVLEYGDSLEGANRFFDGDLNAVPLRVDVGTENNSEDLSCVSDDNLNPLSCIFYARLPLSSAKKLSLDELIQVEGGFHDTKLRVNEFLYNSTCWNEVEDEARARWITQRLNETFPLGIKQ